MTQGIPPHIAARIRAAGPVTDLDSVCSVYKDLLNAQVQGAVEVTRNAAYGPDACHRVDIYRLPRSAAPRPIFSGVYNARLEVSAHSQFGLHARCSQLVVLRSAARTVRRDEHRATRPAAERASQTQFRRAVPRLTNGHVCEYLSARFLVLVATGRRPLAGQRKFDLTRSFNRRPA